MNNDKERLESIKRSSEYVTYREMGNDSVVRVEIVISENHFNWLIAQAERVKELEHQNKRYKQVLEFYAKEYGAKRAILALEGEE